MYNSFPIDDSLRARILATMSEKDLRAADAIREKRLKKRTRIDYPEIVIYGEAKTKNGLPVAVHNLDGRIVGKPYHNKLGLEIAMRTEIMNAVKDRIAEYPYVPQGEAYVSVRIYLATPKKLSPGEVVLAEAGEIQPPKKPDLDNTAKLLFDAAKTAIWKDDVSVVKMLFEKYYSLQPRTVIASHVYLDSPC